MKKRLLLIALILFLSIQIEEAVFTQGTGSDLFAQENKEVLKKEQEGRILYKEKPDGVGETSIKSLESDKKRLTARRLLAEAWNKFEQSDYGAAIGLFELASAAEDAQIQQEALYGKALTLLKLKKFEEASQILERLIRDGYRLDETIPVFMGLYESTEDWARAEKMIKSLPPSFQDQWTAKLTDLKKSVGESALRKSLAEGWKLLRENLTSEAYALFVKTSKAEDPNIQKEARAGMAYAAWRLGNVDEAESLLAALIEEGYNLEQSTLDLIELLLAEKKWEKARQYAGRLPSEQKKKTIERIEKLYSERDQPDLGAMLGAGWDHFNAGRLKSALAAFSKAEESSKPAERREALLGKAYTYLKMNQASKAAAIFKTLVNEDFQTDKTLPGLIDSLFASKKPGEAQKYLSSLSPSDRKKYEARIFELHVDLMKERFSQMDVGTDEYWSLADRILRLHPQDDGVRAALAWACHNHKKFDCALEHFSFLHRKNPSNPVYFQGLVYSLTALNRFDRALEAVDSWTGTETGDIRKLKIQVYRLMGDRAYGAKNLLEAELHLSKALTLDPENIDIMETLAWVYYERQKMDKALELFRKIYELQKSSKSAQNVLLALEKLERDRESSVFVEKMIAEESDPRLRKVAADYFYRHGSSIRAAQIYKGDDACYYNWDSNRLETRIFYTSKEGSDGTSRLARTVWPVRLHTIGPGGGEWIWGVKTERLDAGQAPAGAYIGRFYRFIENPAVRGDDNVSSIDVWSPEVAYVREGPFASGFRVGTSPLNGPIAARPEFEIAAEDFGKWRLEMHQSSVKESIQSYVGQKDPYSDDEWGRVLKTGLSVNVTFPLGNPYWLSLGGGYDFYWGENVVDNHALSANVSAGRTDALWDGELSSGLFFSYRHFRVNTDFFTYGHGGYFSPQSFVVAGPFVRYLSQGCKDYLLDIEASMGYMSYHTDDAPHYHHLEENIAALNRGVLPDVQGMYNSEDESGLVMNGKIQLMKLIGDHFAVGGEAGLNTSSNHNQWHTGLMIQFFFEPKKTISPNSTDQKLFGK
jgi:thioredoxin-like negative regulator of GroEL